MSTVNIFSVHNDFHYGLHVFIFVSVMISYQYTLRSHYINLVEKLTFNVNRTVVYTHASIPLLAT